MNVPKIEFDVNDALSLDEMKQLDLYAVEKYHLPIELMMENAGFHLARIVAANITTESNILIGVGKGNNGGGGLVAARRLLGWGFPVSLLIPDEKLNDLPKAQLERALAFGAMMNPANNPDVFVDAFFGFSQQLPLPDNYLNYIHDFNKKDCIRISLDIPSGISDQEGVEFVKADIVCALAAPKKVLFIESLHARILVADLGIPRQVYEELGYKFDIPFGESGVFEIEVA